MNQAYSDPKRETEPTALPDLEVWEVRTDEQSKHTIFECGCCSCFHLVTFYGDCRDDSNRYEDAEDYARRNGIDWRLVEETDTPDAGWYWQSCFPGCLPDGDPVGPFESEAEALADAREGMED